MTAPQPTRMVPRFCVECGFVTGPVTVLNLVPLVAVFAECGHLFDPAAQSGLHRTEGTRAASSR